MVNNVHSYLNLFLQIYFIKVTQTLTCFLIHHCLLIQLSKMPICQSHVLLHHIYYFPGATVFGFVWFGSIVISHKEALMVDICSDSNVMGPSVMLDQILSALLTCW